MTNLLVEWIKFEEGFRQRPYRDTVGIRTVGYGRNLEAHPLAGRNWTRDPCSRAEAERWLRDELGDLYFALRKSHPLIEDAAEARSAALLNMAYQLGLGGLLRFKRMWAAIEDRAWIEAALHAEDSRWATQTPKRARRICRTLESGEWPNELLRAVSRAGAADG